MDEQPPLRSLERWILAVEFLLRAEEAGGRGSPTDHTIAVILADTASESVLSLLAGLDGDPASDKFPTLLNGAIAAVKVRGARFPVHLGRTLTATHLTRNNAIHHGIDIPDSAAAIDSARRLLGILPSVSRTFPDVPPGSGLLGAVAALVAPAVEVAALLREAESLTNAGAWSEAAAAGAQALHRARSQSTPNVTVTADSPGALDRETDRLIRPIYAHIRQIETWLVPIALGMRASDFVLMERVLGRTIEDVTGRLRVLPMTEPDPTEIRRALDQLAEVVVRLWSTGSMFRGSRDAFQDDMQERWLHAR